MKKIMLMMILSVLLFTQCKKDDGDSVVENDAPIPIKLEISLNKTRTDFSELFPFGKINWGNADNVECIYLAVPYAVEYCDVSMGFYTQYLGVLVELKAEVNEKKDKLVFYGEVGNNIIMPTGYYTAYYFGGRENVVDSVYTKLSKNHIIGKKIMFDSQMGSIDELGNYHLAKADVKITRNVDAIGRVQSYDLSIESFTSKNSIALLDLEGVTELKGSAVKLKSFSVRWNEDYVFEEEYEYDSTYVMSVNSDVKSKFFLSLLPTKESVTLECAKGIYEFPNGIESNQVYIGGNGNSIEDVKPLRWRKP